MPVQAPQNQSNQETAKGSFVSITPFSFLGYERIVKELDFFSIVSSLGYLVTVDLQGVCLGESIADICLDCVRYLLALSETSARDRKSIAGVLACLTIMLAWRFLENSLPGLLMPVSLMLFSFIALFGVIMDPPSVRLFIIC